MNIALAVNSYIKPQVGIGLIFCLAMGGNAVARDHSLPTPTEAQQIVADCRPLFGQAKAWRAFETVKVLVQSQGMRLVVQACPFVRTGFGTMQQVLDVRVQIADSETAAQFVRGPLADGEEVDMGDVHVLASALEDDISPDVQFNREWLVGVMQKRGLQAVDGHWWAFVPKK